MAKPKKAAKSKSMPMDMPVSGSMSKSGGMPMMTMDAKMAKHMK